MFSLTGNYCKKGRGNEWKGGRGKGGKEWPISLFTRSHKNSFIVFKRTLHSLKYSSSLWQGLLCKKAFLCRLWPASHCLTTVATVPGPSQRRADRRVVITPAPAGMGATLEPRILIFNSPQPMVSVGAMVMSVLMSLMSPDVTCGTRQGVAGAHCSLPSLPLVIDHFRRYCACAASAQWPPHWPGPANHSPRLRCSDQSEAS